MFIYRNFRPPLGLFDSRGMPTETWAFNLYFVNVDILKKGNTDFETYNLNVKVTVLNDQIY